MKKIVLLVLFLTTFVFASNQCIVCHKGIEDIREHDSLMMKAILEVAEKAGHIGNDCIVCHGGNPKTKKKKYAHKGTVKYFKTHKGPKEFYPAPASSTINKNTCGVCHPNQVASQNNSLMATQQEKIQDALWSFGAKEGYTHTIANYTTKNPEDNSSRLGTQTYRDYMQKLSSMEPQAFPLKTEKLPDAPSMKEIHKDPSLAVYSYLNQENSGATTGCGSCHVPTSNSGYYEGNDKSTTKKRSGHILTHQIQSSRNVNVSVNDINYSGIPVESCATCHNSGKSIGYSYEGVMQMDSKRFLHMKEDIHYEKGMLCQDCHTSNDMHGDGFLSGASQAAVEIECQDCHGTTKSYPWELPIGYGDEFSKTEVEGEARGVAQSVAEYLKQGFVSEKEDGFILSARGNPLVKAVKKGNTILLHLASGKDIELKPLKLLKEQNRLSQKALIAMDVIDSHTQDMECYSCHASWAPQRYGSDISIEYVKNKKKASVKFTHSQSYIRWEEPALAQNGEGRVSPVIPQNLTSMTPLQPHTMRKEARSCESCHTSDKALGLGIDGGKFYADIKDDSSRFVDENGTQLMRVGGHFTLAKALGQKEIDKLDRRGICMSCHYKIPEGNLAISAMSHIAEMAEIEIDNKEHQSILNKILNIGAWFQIFFVVFVLLMFVYIIYTVFIKKRSINPRNRGWK